MSGDRAWILWRIFVFAIVKQCLDLDYDALEYRANHDSLLRQLLGHGKEGFDPAASSGLWTCAVIRRFFLAGANPAQHLSFRLGAARAVYGGNDMD